VSGGRDQPPVWLAAAGPGDIDAVVEIEKLSYGEPWSRRQFRAALEGDANQRVLVLRHAGEGGRIVATLVLQVVVDELHVHNVAVDPAHRGRGLGRRLLELGLAYGARRGTRLTFLEVRRSNEVALRLYASLGFDQVGVRRGYYAKPREDALVLRRRAAEDR
jgi:ribosomal-protein-alanine N-acetyltransferase